MSLIIDFPETVERRLAERAGNEGKTTEKLVIELIEKAVVPSLDEILAPFRQSFEESGMTEDELDALIEEAREEVWQEEQKAKS